MTCRSVALVGFVALLGFALAGCDQSPPAKAPAASPATQAAKADDVAAIQSMLEKDRPAAPQGSAMQGLPPGHPPMPGVQPTAPAGMPPGHPPVGEAASGTLKYSPPSDWKPSRPASAMRKAQFVLPRAGSDEEDGELIVFYFGKNEGGGTRDNIDRWKGQFTRADGKPLEADAGKTEEFESNGLKFTLLDVSGRYAPGMMPGAPAVGPKDDFRMFAAVIETPGGPWFFKATGPSETMAAQADAFRKMLEGMSYAE